MIRLFKFHIHSIIRHFSEVLIYSFMYQGIVASDLMECVLIAIHHGIELFTASHQQLEPAGFYVIVRNIDADQIRLTVGCRTDSTFTEPCPAILIYITGIFKILYTVILRFGFPNLLTNLLSRVDSSLMLHTTL